MYIPAILFIYQYWYLKNNNTILEFIIEFCTKKKD